MSDPNEPSPEASELTGEESARTASVRGEGMLPIVGLGGSAGSIRALQEFFAAMPADSGMVFVVILHLSPEHESALAETLQRSTTMPVVTTTDGVRTQANTVYVIPPGKHLTSANGNLRLTAAHETRGRRVAVDVFFRTLADTHGAQSVAVVLSGADGDGALGLKRIKECGGLTIAQDPDEAEHAGMPRSAIATGMVDWVLAVKEMPTRLAAYAGRRRDLRLPSEEGPHPAEAAAPAADEHEAALRDVLAFLHTRTARDFSYYKRATILRRIARRMQVNGLDDLPGYLVYLRTHAGEAGALLQDLLISVTNFFRDPDSFAALERIIPELFADKGPGDSVRVWVAGCATGEEAYSIAMLLCEHARTLEAPPQLQIFATDLDEDVIREARDGIYPETIATDVSEERLRRFFLHEQGGYRVRREVREIVLFALHDLLKDSPFSRLDLVSCRNLLIYLNRDAQQRAFDIFHFALRSGGRLFLGTSETVEEGSPLFAVIDKKQRLYLQRPGPRQIISVPAGPSTLARALELQERSRERPAVPGRVTVEGVRSGSDEPLRFDTGLAPGELHYRLIERFSPPSILVNAAHEIVHLSESAGRFLQFAGGEPTRNLLRAVHPMLRIELRAALYAAKQTHTVATAFRVPVETGEERSLVDVRVTPAGDLAPDFLLVVFEAHQADGPTALAVPRSAEADQAAQHLERELEATKAHLRETIEESEASTEELKASNEELQAMNEELRSATEELETSREELQSINEELTTVNDDLKNKVEQLARANSDLQNLMAATDIAIVFLDRDLRIMRFTPSARTLFNFISTDLGRPLSDLSRKLDYPEIVADAERALAHLQPAEREVGAGEHCYLARTVPYRTADDHIAGVVLTFLDITGRKQSEEALRLSDSRLRMATDAAELGIWTWDIAQDFVTWANDWPYEFFGIARSDGPINAARFKAEFLHPDDAAEFESAVAQVLQTGSRFYFVGRLRRQKGAVRWIEFSGQATVDTAGVVTKMHGTAADVTERQAQQLALERSEARLRRVFQSNVVGMIRWDLDQSLILEANDEFLRMTGYTRNDLASGLVNFRTLTPPEWTARNEDGIRTIREQGSAAAYEKEYFRKDGSRVPLIIAGTRFEDSPSEGMSFLIDISERKRVEEALRASEERFRALADAISQLAWTARPDGFIHWYNRRWYEYTGTTPQAMEGWGWQSVHDSATLPDVMERWTTSIASGEIFEMTFPLRGADGVFRPFLTRSIPLKDASGKVTQWFGTNTEVGELKRIEQALTEAKEAAEAANQSKDRFLAVLSHELRTPLTPVLMAVGALEHDPELRPDVREDLVMIKRNVELETKLIDDLLDLSRITSSKVELKTEAVDLNAAMRDVCAICRPQILEQNVHLETDLGEDVCLIPADPARLHQVLWNVLRNAVKFTPPQGTIHVSTARLGPNRCAVRVRDNGIGIPPEVLPRIFNAFEQGDTNVTRQFGGLGLGLAICKALVELHGGTIRAESAGQGRGATFIIELPGQSATPALAAPTVAPTDHSSKAQIRLLLVEDHADTARTLSRLLRAAGFVVVTASDVAEAIATAEREQFDLLVSDLGLPDGTGYEIMRAVRAKRIVPGIAMSGYGMNEDIRRSHEAGFTEHLVKPIAIPLLIAAIHRVTDNRG